MEAETIAERDAQAGDGGAKRRQIMDGARAVFLSDGFDGASMNDIARAAGVSKGTLYAYFDSKEQLFEALIREDRSQQAERLCSLPVDRSDPRALLGALGHRLIEVMTRPETIAHVRVVIAATAKFPRLGRAFYEAGPLYGTQKLAAQLDAFVEFGLARNRRYATRGAAVPRPLSVRRAQAAAFRRRRFGGAERDRRRGRRRGRRLSESLSRLAHGRPAHGLKRPSARLAFPPSRRYRSAPDRRLPRSHRLAVQDVALSRRKLGFDSPWERQFTRRAGSSRITTLPQFG